MMALRLFLGATGALACIGGAAASWGPLPYASNPALASATFDACLVAILVGFVLVAIALAPESEAEYRRRRRRALDKAREAGRRRFRRSCRRNR